MFFVWLENLAKSTRKRQKVARMPKTAKNTKLRKERGLDFQKFTRNLQKGPEKVKNAYLGGGGGGWLALN